MSRRTRHTRAHLCTTWKIGGCKRAWALASACVPAFEGDLRRIVGWHGCCARGALMKRLVVRDSTEHAVYSGVVTPWWRAFGGLRHDQHGRSARSTSMQQHGELPLQHCPQEDACGGMTVDPTAALQPSFTGLPHSWVSLRAVQ
eukprot:scaffold51735_cov20-Tisochrysis_lutea.AAC.3